MEQEYLIDTNIAIDYLDDKLPKKGADLIDSIISRISVITRMELLGWPDATREQTQVLKQFVDSSVVFNLDEPLIVKAISVRKLYRTKLPDAIIAATALVHHYTLLTRNTNDFKNIPGLKLLNPFEQ